MIVASVFGGGSVRLSDGETSVFAVGSTGVWVVAVSIDDGSVSGGVVPQVGRVGNVMFSGTGSPSSIG